MAKRYLSANGFNSSQVALLSGEQVLLEAERVSLESASVGWDAAMIPSERTKKLAFASSVALPSANLSIREVLNADPCGFAPHKPESSLSGVSEDLERLDQSVKASTNWTDRAALAGGSTVLCSELVGYSNLISCVRNLKGAVEIMRPRGAVEQFTQVALYQKVIGTGAYDKGLKLAAERLLTRYESESVEKGDIFSDLKTSFAAAGASVAQAEQQAFDVLGLLSTAGANFNIRIDKLKFDGHRWPTVTALTTIAAALPALDHKHARAGRLYSWPEGIEGRCDTSKSYHFWIAAYLARKLAIDSGNAEAAVAAAVSANKAYHNVGNATSRTPGVILSHSPFSPASQVIRADLSYAVSGAVFGGASSTGVRPKLNVDHGLATLLENSQVQHGLSPEQIGGSYSYSNYRRWSATFAPNSLYQEQIAKVKLNGHVRAQDFQPPASFPRCGASGPAK